MPTESELREQLHEGEPTGSIDLESVLRRARSRRRPRLAALVVVSSLAVAGIVVPVSIGAIGATGQNTAALRAGSARSGADSATAPEALQSGASTGSGTLTRAPAEKINPCTGALADPAPADDGLVLTVQPVDAAAATRDIPVIVTLTNTGAEPVTGSLSPFPVLTLSRDGVVLWHSNGAVPSLAREIDLAPGASTDFPTTFEPVVCGVEDDARPSFRSDLPPVGPGTYRLSAAVDFRPATTTEPSGGDLSGAAVLVTGPTSPVTLH